MRIIEVHKLNKMEKNKKTIVVNLFGGPCSCKTTFCAAIFAELKKRDINCEMALEFAKEIVYEGNLNRLKNQLYLFSEQHERITRLVGKVDVIVTDSPLISHVIYDLNNDHMLQEVIIREQKIFNDLGYFLIRGETYSMNGRYHTFEQAKEIDIKIKNLLNLHKIKHQEIGSDIENVDMIVKEILEVLNKN